MPLPRDALLPGEHPGQLPPVEQPDQQRHGRVPPALLDQATGQQQAEVTEDHAAGTDVHGPGSADQPHAEARHEHDQRRGPQEPPHPRGEHERAEQDQWDTVGHQVREAGVEQRREQDAVQPVGVAGLDATGHRQADARGRPVEHPDEEQHRHDAAHHHERAPETGVEGFGAEARRCVVRPGQPLHHAFVRTRRRPHDQIAMKSSQSGAATRRTNNHSAARRCAAVSPFAATGRCAPAAASPNLGMLP